MDAASMERALEAFYADVRHTFMEKLARVRAATGSRNVTKAKSRFDCFPDSFASLRDFYAGADATLQLGCPNLDTMEGIRLEHTAHPSVARLFVTPNHRFVTCLLIEYCWAVDPYPQPKAALDLLSRLRADRGESGNKREDRDLEENIILARLDNHNPSYAVSLLIGDKSDVDIDITAGTIAFRYNLPG